MGDKFLVRGWRMECIRFADYMVLLAEVERILNGILRNFVKSSQESGMKINVKKTKRMVKTKLAPLHLSLIHI